MKNNILKKLISLIMLLALITGMTSYAYSDSSDAGVIYYEINSESDIKKLASMCRLDTWSSNVVINLNSDITLKTQFDTIPYFSGTFNGNGHTIKNLKIYGDTTNAGLFGILTESAVVKNLNVIGNIYQSGDNTPTGGIAAINNGTIMNCVFSGSIESMKASGGIAGENYGIITECRNYADVNTDIKDTRLKLSDISLSDLSSMSLKEIVGIATENKHEFSGGIAGANYGYIYSSENNGTVGTENNGSAVGGITGKNEGFIGLCSNYGTVLGSDKVGGIVGQSVPFLKTNYSEDLLTPVADEAYDILDLVDDITYDLDGDTDNIISDISSILDTISQASGHASVLTAAIQNSVNTKITEVDQIVQYANSASNGLGTIASDVSGLGDHLNSGVNNIKTAVSSVKSMSDISASLKYIQSAMSDFSLMSEDISDATTDLELMLKNMNEIGIPEFSEIGSEVSGSVTLLTNDISALTVKIKKLASSIQGTENNITGNVRNITEEARTLINGITDIAYSLSDVSLSDFITDESDKGYSENDSKFGVIDCCLNTGEIHADKNGGGIVGSMGISGISGVDQRESTDGFSIKTLSYRSIVSYSRNFGKVIVRQDYAGGICGNHGIGAIVECQGYGYIQSTEGEYVGGIAGKTSGLIRDCFAKTILSGSDYVGGIVGTGNSGGILGDSTVTSSYAETKIISDSLHNGGISGFDEGTYILNYFTAGNLNGICTYSKEFEAAPVKSGYISSLDNCPKEFLWSYAELLNASTSTTNTNIIKTIIVWCIIAAIAVALIALTIYAVFFKNKKKTKTAALPAWKYASEIQTVTENENTVAET